MMRAILNKMTAFRSKHRTALPQTSAAEGANLVAEQAAPTSEHRLSFLGKNIPNSAIYEYVWQKDGSRKFLYVSESMEQLSGISAAEVLKNPAALHQQILEEYREKIYRAEERSAETFCDFNMEVPMRRPDGEVRWMRLHSRPRRLPDGGVAWDGLQTDVTEERRVSNELKESRELLRLAASAARLFTFEWDAKRNIARRDSAADELLGFASTETSAEDYFSRIYPEDRPKFISLVRALSPSADRYQIVYRVIRPDGLLIWLEESGQAIFDDDGVVTRMIGIRSR